MPDISKDLQAIMDARYGRDVRDAIYDALYDINDAVEHIEPVSGVKGVNGKTGNVTLAANDVGALPADTHIPSALSELNDDSNHRLVTDANKAAWSAKANASDIPTALSSLSDDATHRLVTDAEKTAWNSKSNFSGNYNDLTNKPAIPTKTSDLTNDSNFVTNSDIPDSLADLSDDSAHRTVSDSEKTAWNSKSVVAYNQLVSTGTKIAEITIDGTKTDIYAPEGGGDVPTPLPTANIGDVIQIANHDCICVGENRYTFMGNFGLATWSNAMSNAASWSNADIENIYNVSDKTLMTKTEAEGLTQTQRQAIFDDAGGQRVVFLSTRLEENPKVFADCISVDGNIRYADEYNECAWVPTFTISEKAENNMTTSVYDPQGEVANAGGISAYVTAQISGAIGGNY